MDQLDGNYIRNQIIDETNWECIKKYGWLTAYSCQDIIDIGRKNGVLEKEIQKVLHKRFDEFLVRHMRLDLEHFEDLIEMIKQIDKLNPAEIYCIPLLCDNPHHWEIVYKLLKEKKQIAKWFDEMMKDEYRTITAIEKNMQRLSNIKTREENFFERITWVFGQFATLRLLRPELLLKLIEISPEFFPEKYSQELILLENFISRYYQKMRRFPLDLWWKNPVEYTYHYSLLDNEKEYLEEFKKIVTSNEFSIAVELLSRASDSEKIELLKSGDIFHCISSSQILRQIKGKYYFEEARHIFAKIVQRKISGKEFQQYKQYTEIK